MHLPRHASAYPASSSLALRGALLFALLLQARAISAWKLSPRSAAAAAKLPRLDDNERHMLAGARSRRLNEVASKQCLQVIKALMAHKVCETSTATALLLHAACYSMSMSCCHTAKAFQSTELDVD
jgi:hypothetical protein